MKLNQRQIYALGALLMITVIATFPLLMIRQVNPAKAFWLSPTDLSSLERSVAFDKNGDAAYRIALYYERSVHDIPTAILWRQKAAALGNKTAQDWVADFLNTRASQGAEPPKNASPQPQIR